MKGNIGKQGGFSAMIVIVLIVLFALIGTYMLSLTAVSSINTTMSAGAMQAWFAARSGVDWAVQRVLNGGCAAVGPTLNFSGGSLDGFQATISCPPPTTVTEGPDTYDIFNIGVTASRGAPGQLNFVSRTINVTVTDRNAP